MKRFTALCISLWLGAQLGFGYVVAPILFTHLDKNMAGELAGQLFHISNGLGLFAWSLAYIVVRKASAWDTGKQHKMQNKWIILLLILFAISEFAITPTIAALKTGEIPLLAQWLSDSFKTWHGISSTFHLLQSLLGFGLMVKLLRFTP